MFIIKNSGQYEHITNLQPRSKYVTHRNNKSQKNIPLHITQSPKISNQQFREEVIFPSESFEPKKHKQSYSVDQINFLNNKLIQSTHKAKLKRLTSAAPLSIKSFPKQSTPLNENVISSNINLSYHQIQPTSKSNTYRPHSAMNIISKSHSLELLSKSKQKPSQHSSLYKLVPSNCCSTTTDRYKPTSFNLFLQKINDSNLYKQSIKQINITKYLKHKELSSRNLYCSNNNNNNSVHDTAAHQQRHNISNVFNTIDHSAMPSASSKELLDRFSRVFQSNSSVPLDPVQKYATLINHESNKCYIYNTAKRNESAFTKEEIMKNTSKRNVFAKNQMVGNYINKTRSFSNKENKEYMKFYNRNPKCFRIQKSIGKDLDEMYKGYKGVCEWPFKREVKVE